MWKIRKLRADEIEVRPQIINNSGFSVLLYKNARADMNVLDECFGPENWQRKHAVVNNNLFCSVLIWDEEKKMWIEKQDVGTPSNAEAEKGEASDAFKRACTNVGIGRELYTAPKFMWVNGIANEIETNGKSYKLKNSTKLHVSAISYDENKIIALQIRDQNDRVRYTFGDPTNQVQGTADNASNPKRDEVLNFARAKNVPPETMVGVMETNFGKKSTRNLTDDQLDHLLDMLRQMYREA